MSTEGTRLNPEFLRLTGHDSFDRVKGKNVHQLTHHTKADGTPYPASDCPIYQSLFSGRTTQVDTEVFWRKDGSEAKRRASRTQPLAVTHSGLSR